MVAAQQTAFRRKGLLTTPTTTTRTGSGTAMQSTDALERVSVQVVPRFHLCVFSCRAPSRRGRRGSEKATTVPRLAVPVPARNTALPTAASRPAAMAAAHRRLTALNTHVTSLLSPAAAAPHNFHPVGASSSPTTAAAAADASLPRVGIVGLGGRGTGTLNTIEESELLQSKMNLVALCDIDPAALAPHAEKLGLTLFSDASELIQSGLIDTLLIITCETVSVVFFSVFLVKRKATLDYQDTLRTDVHEDRETRWIASLLAQAALLPHHDRNRSLRSGAARAHREANLR